METNAQIRIYMAGIYLIKASSINSRTSCEICSKLTKTSKRPHWQESITKHWWRSDVFIVNFEQGPHLFLVFHSLIWESVVGWVYWRRSRSRYVNIMKHARAGTKFASNLKRMQSKALSKYLWHVLRFSFYRRNFFLENKIGLKTSSVAITDTSIVDLFHIWCFARFKASHTN